LNKKIIIVGVATVIFVLVLLMSINLISGIKDADMDGDGLLRQEELKIGTNPEIADTDYDGIPDGDEYEYWMKRYKETGNEDYRPDGDIDGDGIINILDDDSDNDGVKDGIELDHDSDPTKTDTDGDGLSDFEEINLGNDGFITDPNNQDTDQDGIPDAIDEFPDGAPKNPGDLSYGDETDQEKQSDFIRSGGDADVTCFAIFDPYLSGLKRHKVFDIVDADYTAKISTNGQYDKISVSSNQRSNVFTGIITLDLTGISSNDYIRIPSVAPNANIINYETAGGLTLDFYKDREGGADNYYVKPTGQFPSSDYETLEYTTSCSDSYYFYDIPNDIPNDRTLNDISSGVLKTPPSSVQQKGNEVIDELGLTGETNLKTIVSKLYDHFSSFEGDTEDNDCEIDPSEPDDYVATALSQCGCCYVRSFSCFITANCIGLPARLVTNECHAFVEIYLPDNGWTMMQLGGCGTDFSNPDSNDPFDPDDSGPDDTTECGNGICESGEDCNNCEEDCGPCIEDLIRTQTNVTKVSSANIYKTNQFWVEGTVIEVDDSQPVSNMPITVYLNESKETIGSPAGTGTTNSLGIFNITCIVPDDIPAGENNINAHAEGIGGYGESWSDPTINIYSNSKIVFDMKSTIGENNPLTIKGILYDDKNLPIKDQIVDISVNGQSEGWDDTNYLGEFQKTFYNDSYQKGDTLTIKANFSGTSYINASEKTTTVLIKDKNTSLKITVNPEQAIRGNKIKIEGSLTSGNNDKPDNQQIKIYFNNNTYTTKTNQGNFEKEITIPSTCKLGFSTIKTEFEPTDQLAESSAEKTITIFANTSITLNSLSKKNYNLNETFYVNGTLLDDNNNPLPNNNISITFLSSEKRVLTDQNGSFSTNFTIPVTTTPGKSDITIEFKGNNDFYKQSINSTKINIANTDANEESQNIYHILLFSAIILITILGVIMLFKKKRGEKGPSIEKIASETIDNLEQNDDYRQAVINCYRQMCDWLSRQGLHKNDFQTPREFAMVSKDYLRIAPETLYTLTQIFEKARYSKKPININDKNQAIQCLNEIVSQPIAMENQEEIPDYQNTSQTPGY
jgi:hypothetical protein